MPRYKREKSNTKLYYVIIRGINKQDIFLDRQDYFKFVKEVKRTKEDNLIRIQSYNKKKREASIIKILSIQGIKKNQISRIIGIDRKTITKIEKNNIKKEKLLK